MGGVLCKLQDGFVLETGYFGGASGVCSALQCAIVRIPRYSAGHRAANFCFYDETLHDRIPHARLQLLSWRSNCQ